MKFPTQSFQFEVNVYYPPTFDFYSLFRQYIRREDNNGSKWRYWRNENYRLEELNLSPTGASRDHTPLDVATSLAYLLGFLLLHQAFYTSSSVFSHLLQSTGLLICLPSFPWLN